MDVSKLRKYYNENIPEITAIDTTGKPDFSGLNIRSSNDEINPNFSEHRYSSTAGFPRLDNLLRAAYRNDLEQKANSLPQSKIIEAELPKNRNKSILDLLHEAGIISPEQASTNERVAFLQDSDIPYDRTEITEHLFNLVRNIEHPELRINKKVASTPEERQELYNRNLDYAKQLTAFDPEKSGIKINRDQFLPNMYGQFDDSTKELSLRPGEDSTSTFPHELLHAKDFSEDENAHSSREKLFNIKDIPVSKFPTQDYYISKGGHHSMQNMNIDPQDVNLIKNSMVNPISRQHLEDVRALFGEDVVYYNKIKELLKKYDNR